MTNETTKKTTKPRVAGARTAARAGAKAEAKAGARAGARAGAKGAARAALSALERLADKKTLDGMERYGIPSDHALGVSVGRIQQLAKKLGTDHELAAQLWDTEVYEARMLAVFVDDPARVTPAQLERWCRDFDSWAICDTACFKLFDRVPHAFAKVDVWAKRSAEFEKRAAFALLACLALHVKDADDAWFERRLELVERHANDERNFVKKGVLWALRGIGSRSAELRVRALRTAGRLAESDDATARWIGKTARRELEKGSAKRRAK